MGNTTSGRRRVKVDEQYTRPQGLYPDRERDVDAKKLRRLILDGKLAACFPGVEEAHADLEECPICFLHYPSLNRSRCCAKGICTECFLQMKSPVASRPTQCPFCKTPGYAVEYRGPKGAAEKGREQAEEQRVIMATLRMRQEEQTKAVERSKKREKDLSEGRVPDPPSPTLFPPPPPRMPAFPPAPTTQSPQSVNTPPQLRTQSPGSIFSDQGGADRGGSGGVRRRSSLNKRVSAIEPDNLWFRAGSSPGSASNSRRTSAIGQQEASGSPATYSDFVHTLLASTADTQMNAVATPGTARSSNETAEEGGGAPMPVLRAISRSGHEDMEVDLDDVMLNEAIWLSIQEEEERQRRSSQGGPAGAPNTEPVQTLTSYQTTPQTHLQTPSYEDPEEAAASELAKAIAASLEESATWRPAIGGETGQSPDGGDGAGGSLDVGYSLSAPWPVATGWDTNLSADMGASHSGSNVMESGERFGGQPPDGLGVVSESAVRTGSRQRLEDLLDFEAGGEVNSADRGSARSAEGGFGLDPDRKPEASGSGASKRTELDPNSQRPRLAWRSGRVAAVGGPEVPVAEDGVQQGFEQGLEQGPVQYSKQGLEQGAVTVQASEHPNQDAVRTESLGEAHSGSGHSEGPIGQQKEGNGGSGTRVASAMAAPLGSEPNALPVEPGLVDLGAPGEGLDFNPFRVAADCDAELSDETRPEERSHRLPMFAHLRSDSLYRSVERGEPHRGAAAESPGLVSATMGAVEPLSLAQLAGRKAKTGPGSDEGIGTGKNEGEGVSNSKSIESGLEPTRVQFSASDAPWGEKWGVSDPSLEVSSVIGKPLEENSRTSEAREKGGAKPAWRGLEKGETEVQSLGSGYGSVELHGKGGRFSTDDAPWQDLMGKNGFASTNPFAGKQGEGALHVPPPASLGLSFETGHVEKAGLASKEKRVENKPLVNGQGIDGDLYLPLDEAPGVGLREMGSSSDAHSRRTRSLSGSATCSLPSDRIEVASFSPVRYPPPRISDPHVGSDGFDTCKSVHRRSVSSKESTCDTFGSCSEKRHVGEGASRQRLSSDATFEEQMAAAIAMSLAETKADEQRRKEHEMFEKEAFCVTVETKPS